MAVFEVLRGLPPYGALPRLISGNGSPVYREGLVVRFGSGTNDEWVGNFQHGLGDLNIVTPHPNGRDVVVVAGGQCYVVNPSTQDITSGVGGHIDQFIPIPETNAFLLSSGIYLSRLGTTGIEWRTRRLSWDGFQALAVTEFNATGEAWHFDGSWHPFKVDLASGQAEGGAYEGPEP